MFTQRLGPVNRVNRPYTTWVDLLAVASATTAEGDRRAGPGDRRPHEAGPAAHPGRRAGSAAGALVGAALVPAPLRAPDTRWMGHGTYTVLDHLWSRSQIGGDKRSTPPR